MKKIITTLAVSLLVLFILIGYSTEVNSDLSQNIVRLHVIANSDSKADQQLKLKVRDAVLKKTSSDFTSKAQIPQKIDAYREIAQKTVIDNGYDYRVSVEYGNFKFPTKHYSNLSLPAGSYDAVRIKIGKAEGKNWWCVLFPPLCFVDGTTDTKDAQVHLKSLISSESYDIITAKQNGENVPFEIKFKIVEMYGKLSGHDKLYLKAGKDN